MDTIDQGTFLIVSVLKLEIQNLGFVKQLVVKAQHTLVLGINRHDWRSHSEKIES